LETLLILRRDEADSIINVHKTASEVPVTFNKLKKKNKYKKLTVHGVEGEMFHAGV
jgi:hypothetical protein